MLGSLRAISIAQAQSLQVYIVLISSSIGLSIAGRIRSIGRNDMPSLRLSLAKLTLATYSRLVRASGSKTVSRRTVRILFLIRSSLTLVFTGLSSFRRLKALGRIVWDPRRQTIRKSNYERNSDYHTYRQFRALVEVKYSRFLWSVMTSKGSQVPYSLGYHSFRLLIIARSSLSQIS